MVLDKEVIVFDDEIFEIGEAVFTLTRLIEFCFLFTIKHLEYPALTLAQYIEGESERKLDKIARF